MPNYRSTKFACYSGLVVQAIVNNFLPILFIVFQDNYGIGYEKLGRLILYNFAIQMVADALTAKIVKKIGYRYSAILCQACAATGLLLLAILPSVIKNTYFAVTISLLVYAFSSGLMEVILSPMVEMLPTNHKKSNMALLHSFYCWGQALTIIVTTILLHSLGFNLWQFIPAIWAVVPIINMIAFVKVPVVEINEDEKQTSFKKLLMNKKFICYMILMVCAGACEIAMSEWASLFAQNALGVNKVIGDLSGPFAFALFMGAGRILYAKFADKVSIRSVLIVMGIFCTACYLIVGLCNIPMLALIACALCGFTVSITWPGTYSASAYAFPNGGTAMFGILALCGDLGCSTGPWLLGFVAERVSFNSGFIAAAIFPVIMVITSVLFIKNN